MILPHNKEAERGIIGSLFIDPEGSKGIIDMLLPEDFYYESNEIVFRAVYQMMNNNEPVDLITVADKLGEKKLERIGGYLYLNKIASNIASTMNLEAYVDIVIDLSTKRNQISLAQNFVKGLLDGEDVDHLEFSNMIAESSKSKVISDHITAGVSSVYDIVHGDGIKFFSTGIVGFDRLLGGGIAEQEFTITAGEAGIGKTMLYFQVGLKVAMSGIPVAFYSLEMTKERLILRFVSAMTGIKVSELKKGKDGNFDRTAVNKSLEFFQSLPIYIADRPSLTTRDIYRDLSKRVRDDGVKFALVDYMNITGDAVEIGDDIKAGGVVSKRLMAVQRKLKIAIWAIQSIRKGDDTPDMKSLFGSSQQQYDPDNILILTKDKQDGKDIEGTLQTKNGSVRGPRLSLRLVKGRDSEGEVGGGVKLIKHPYLPYITYAEPVEPVRTQEQIEQSTYVKDER